MQNQCKLTLPGADAVTIKARLERDLDEAERKAHRNLARYKFQQFGYWAAIWVHLNRVGQFQRPNPFVDYVKLAGTKNTVTRKGVRIDAKAKLVRQAQGMAEGAG